MVFWRRNVWLLAAAGPFLAHCAPDFDALSTGYAAGLGSSPSGGDATAGGTSSNGGGDAGGTTNGGGTTSGGVSGQAATSGSGGMPQSSGSGGSQGSTGGTTSVSGAAGDGGAADLGGEGGLGGASGAGPDPGCVTPHAGQLGYDDFDTSLVGVLFPQAYSSASTQTTHAATCTAVRDPAVGKTCPGSLHVAAAFKAYASGSAVDEQAYAQIDFSFADWSKAAALHVMLKVSPKAPPITGVQLFLQSGDNYAYDSIFDGGNYASGSWVEMIFPLPGTKLDVTKVRRLGVQLTLDRAGTSNIPATPPTVDVWIDDVWLEAR